VFAELKKAATVELSKPHQISKARYGYRPHFANYNTFLNFQAPVDSGMHSYRQ